MALYTTFKSLALTSLLLLATTTATTAATTTTSGAVYVMTNRVGGIGNSVLIFNRHTTDGTLNRVGLVDTGGLGGTVGLAGLAPDLNIPEVIGQAPNPVSGSPNDALASQDSLVVSDTGRCLFAVNAGSNTITSFIIRNEGNFLDLAGIYPSGGAFPLSITQRGNTAYVLNGGLRGSIVGFRHSDITCALDPLHRATRDLDNIDFNPPSLWFSPAQVSITPNGKGIVATVKGKHEIHYWSLDSDGRPAAKQVITQSIGFVPFSFDFDGNGNLVVGEAFGAGTAIPSPSAGAVSTYAINDDDGTLSVISASVPNGQTATCWLRYSDGMVFTSNNDGPTPSISTYAVDSQGGVSVLESPAADAQQGIDRPIDISVSNDGDFLYVLNTGSLTNGTGIPSISVFKVAGSGSLELVDAQDKGLPAGTSLSEFNDIEGVMGLAVL